MRRILGRSGGAMSGTIDEDGHEDGPWDGPGDGPGDLSGMPDMALAHRLARWIDSPNIAVELDEATCGQVADRVARDYRADEESRAAWKESCHRWLDLARQVSEPKTYPWPGASNVIYPLLANAAVQFAARAYPGIVRDRDVVRGTVLGDDSGVPLRDPSRPGQV
ncbi:hypothetical protein HUK84_20875, partial [Nguyenibacter vanlangensis]|nr:hypothetical protein [Nguyenibacter vanlangensis]